MSEQELTEWFPAEIKPVHIGEYNASYLRNPFVRRWWNGQRWSTDYSNDRDESEKEMLRQIPTESTDIEWRGLKEPK